MSPLQLFKTQLRENLNVLRVCLHSYGFRENVNRMVDSIHKNRIYSKARNATEFVHFWMNKRRSLSEVSSVAYSNRDIVISNKCVGILKCKRWFKYESCMFRKPLYVWMAETKFYLHHKYWSTCELVVIFGLCISPHDMNLQAVRYFMRIYHLIWELS